MNILLHAHSGLRWFVLIMMILTILHAYLAKSKLQVPDKKKINLALYTLILFVLQFVVGLILYFKSHLVSFEAGFMKDSMTRFFTIEHGFSMIAALILIHIGFIRSVRLAYAPAHRSIFIFYLIALILVLIGIPWPFRGFGNAWF